MSLLKNAITIGLAADRPAATGDSTEGGRMHASTDTGVVERLSDDGTAWVLYALRAEAEPGLAAHLADTGDAHDASAISFAPGSGIAATTAQAAIEEAATEAAAALTAGLATKQDADADLTALAGVSATGLLARTGSGTAAARTITGDTAITVTNGDGVAGAPALAFAPSGDVSMGSHKLTNVTDPSGAQDAATKAYVDSVARGLDWKASVRVATMANGTLATAYENGDTVDGVTLATGDRILIKDQSSGAENGIYTVNASGAPTRAVDADASAEVTAGLACFVSEGTANQNTAWVLTTDDPITLGATALAFAQLSGGALASHNHTASGGDGGILTNDEHDGFSEYAEIAAPSTPASGKVRLYPKADGLFYSKDDAGTETLVSGGAGGGGGSSVGATLYLAATCI